MRTAESIALMLAVIGLAACTQSAPPNPLPSDLEGAAVRLTKPRVASTERGSLTAVPGQVGACPGRERIRSKIAWRSDAKFVKVEVSDREGGRRQVFATGHGVGESETGDWVGGNTHFFLVDAETGDDIAMLRIPLVPCVL